VNVGTVGKYCGEVRKNSRLLAIGECWDGSAELTIEAFFG